MFQPVVAKIMASFRRIGLRRIEPSAETLLDAADAAVVLPVEFFSRAVADDRWHGLLSRTLLAAQYTARRNKRRALGCALADSVMDYARIDEELLFVRAMNDIDAWHIGLLDHMANHYPPTPGWSAATVVDAQLTLTYVVNACSARWDCVNSSLPLCLRSAEGRKRDRRSTTSPTRAGGSSTAYARMRPEMTRSAC